MKYDVVIVASGKGQRANLGYNKVFYKMKDGRIVLDCSIDLFLNDDDCINVIVVLNEDDFDQLNNDKVIKVKGGKERKDSVYNGLQKVSSDYVLIHDGARPFLRRETLDLIKNELIDNDAVCLGHMATNTIKVIEDDYIVKTLDRNNIFEAETPQGFKSELIKDCYEKCDDIVFTDDASLVESLNYKVKVVLNKYDNPKLTKEDDFINL